MRPRVLEKNLVQDIAATSNEKKVIFSPQDLYKVNNNVEFESAYVTAFDIEEDLHLNSEIFVVLDKVTSLPILKSLDLRPPQVVVLGMESHGKSTLLERLTKVDVFPKGRVRCTGCIIRLQLRRGPAKFPVICIRKQNDFGGKQY